MAKTPKKKTAKRPAKPVAAAPRAGNKPVELSDAELSKVAGGLGVVKRTNRG